MLSWLILHMKKVTIAMLVALFGAAIAVLGATPHVAFAQSSSSAASATDFGSSAASAGANFDEQGSGASASSGDEATAAGGDEAFCPDSEAFGGGCSQAFRDPTP